MLSLFDVISDIKGLGVYMPLVVSINFINPHRSHQECIRKNMQLLYVSIALMLCDGGVTAH